MSLGFKIFKLKVRWASICTCPVLCCTSSSHIAQPKLDGLEVELLGNQGKHIVHSSDNKLDISLIVCTDHGDMELGKWSPHHCNTVHVRDLLLRDSSLSEPEHST